MYAHLCSIYHVYFIYGLNIANTVDTFNGEKDINFHYMIPKLKSWHHMTKSKP